MAAVSPHEAEATSCVRTPACIQDMERCQARFQLSCNASTPGEKTSLNSLNSSWRPSTSHNVQCTRFAGHGLISWLEVPHPRTAWLNEQAVVQCIVAPNLIADQGPEGTAGP